MATRRLRGDAPAQAQITRLDGAGATGEITLVVNHKVGVRTTNWTASTISNIWNNSVLAEFTEALATHEGTAVVLRARTPGIPFEVTAFVNGEPLADDEQLLMLSPGPTGGTFTLTFDGQTTTALAFNSSAATIAAALEALSNIGPGNVAVSGEVGGPFTIRFVGAMADTDQPELTANRANLTGGDAAVLVETVQEGSGSSSPLLVQQEVAGVAGTNEQQRFRFTTDPGDLSGITVRWACPNSASFNYSEPFPANADLSVMKAALQATRYGNGTTVWGEGLELSGTLANSWVNPTDGVVVEWGGRWKATGLAQIQLQVVAGGGTIASTTITDGAAGTNEVQSLRLVGPPIGEGFRLKLGDKVTGLIVWDSSAASIVQRMNIAFGTNSVRTRAEPSQSGFETLTNMDYDGDGILYFEFHSGGYQSTDVPLMEVVGAGSQEIQAVALTGNPWKGQVTLTLDGQTATALDWDSSAAEVEAALEVLSNVGAGNVTCYGGPWPGATIFCQFDESLANLPQMTATHSLTNASVAVSTIQHGGAAVQITEVQRSSGPEHWDSPINWEDEAGLPGIPESGDTVVLEKPGVNLRYGLRQRCVFTADPTTNRLTLSTGRPTFLEDQAVEVVSSGSLPDGLESSTVYFVRNVSGDTLQLSTTRGGPSIDLTDTGGGTHQIGVFLEALFADSKFSGQLGLPRTNTRNYDEYRPNSLELWAEKIRVGAGDGTGSNRLKLDTGDQATVLEIVQSGGAVETGVPAILWRGEHPDNLVTVASGDLGIALFPEDAAEFAELRQFGGSVALGRQVTTTKLSRFAGELTSLGTQVNGEVVL